MFTFTPQLATHTVCYWEHLFTFTPQLATHTVCYWEHCVHIHTSISYTHGMFLGTLCSHSHLNLLHTRYVTGNTVFTFTPQLATHTVCYWEHCVHIHTSISYTHGMFLGTLVHIHTSISYTHGMSLGTLCSHSHLN